VEKLAEHAIETFNRLDIWMNNAGISAPYGPTAHIDPETFIRVLRTDIFGVFYGSRIAMDHFLQKGAGKLINILGRGDRQPVPNQNAYASSKAWVRNFTLALAKEYKETGIGVFAYNPGLMYTDLLQKNIVIEGYETRLRPLATVMRLWAKPPETPAEKAVWLASAATDGRTGLVVRELNGIALLSGVLGEGLRRLTGRPAPEMEMETETVPPASSAPLPD
jgi:NAD(P)-dependent dehydrogenase (short-subunit alcohol dehydrogenase family)